MKSLYRMAWVATFRIATMSLLTGSGSAANKVELALWSKRWNRGDTCSSTRIRSRASGEARSHSLYLISTSRCAHSQNSFDEVLKSPIRGVMTVSQSPNNKAAFSAEGEGNCGSSKFLIASGSEAVTDSAVLIKVGWRAGPWSGGCPRRCLRRSSSSLQLISSLVITSMFSSSTAH